MALSHSVIASEAKQSFSAVIPAEAGIQNKNDINTLGSQIVRANPATSELSEKSRVSLLAKNILQAIVIPQLTKEVNENKNFAHLRQVYNSLILATWYKKKIKNSILEQVYADKNKVAGVNIDDPKEKEKIYQRYLQAFKKGVYNYIKEESDPATGQNVPRKYFSGGVVLALTIRPEGATRLAGSNLELSYGSIPSSAMLTNDHAMIIQSDFNPVGDNVMKINLRDGDFSRGIKEFSERMLAQSRFTPNGDAQLIRRQQDGKTFHIVSLAEHYSRRSIELLIDQIAPEILSQNPEQVLFLVEGIGNGVPEVQVYQEFAKQRHIAIGDPIVSPYNHAIATLAGVSLLEAAEAFVLMERQQFLQRYPSKNAGQALEELLQEAVLRFNLSSIGIDANLLALTLNRELQTSSIARQEAQIVFDNFVSMSNDLGNGEFKRILNDHPQATHVIVLIGEAHLPIFDPDYQPKKQFTPEEVAVAAQAISIAAKDSLTALLGIRRLPVYDDENNFEANSLQTLATALGQSSYDDRFKQVVTKWHPNLFGFKNKGSSQEDLRSTNSLRRIWGFGRLVKEKLESRSAPLFIQDELSDLSGLLRMIAKERRDYQGEFQELSFLADNIKNLLSLYFKLYQEDKRMIEEHKATRPQRVIAFWKQALTGRGSQSEKRRNEPRVEPRIQPQVTSIGANNIGRHFKLKYHWKGARDIEGNPVWWIPLDSVFSVNEERLVNGQLWIKGRIEKVRSHNLDSFYELPKINRLQEVWVKYYSSDGESKAFKIDEAMIGQEIASKQTKINTGGIDLTSAKMNLQTRNIGGAIKFYLDPAMLKQLQNAPGFVPVIINIQPMRNLRVFLET